MESGKDDGEKEAYIVVEGTNEHMLVVADDVSERSPSASDPQSGAFDSKSQF